MKAKKRPSSNNTAPMAASLTLLILLFGLLAITSSPATVEAASAKSCQADADCAHLVTHYFCNHQLCSCKLFYSVKEAAEKDGCTSIKCTKETDCTEGQDAGHKENVMCSVASGQCACTPNFDMSASNGTACLPPGWFLSTFLWVLLAFCILGWLVGGVALLLYECGGIGRQKSSQSLKA